MTTESLSIKDVAGTQGNVIGEGGLVYQTTDPACCIRIRKCSCWLGQLQRASVSSQTSTSRSNLPTLTSSPSSFLTATTSTLSEPAKPSTSVQGYALEAKQVDVDGEKVWLEFSKDGEYVDDEIISVGNMTPTPGKSNLMTFRAKTMLLS